MGQTAFAADAVIVVRKPQYQRKARFPFFRRERLLLDSVAELQSSYPAHAMLALNDGGPFHRKDNHVTMPLRRVPLADTSLVLGMPLISIGDNDRTGWSVSPLVHTPKSPSPPQ